MSSGFRSPQNEAKVKREQRRRRKAEADAKVPNVAPPSFLDKLDHRTGKTKPVLSVSEGKARQIQRKGTRERYAEQSLEDRKESVKEAGRRTDAGAREVTRFHDERARAERALDAFIAFATKKPKRDATELEVRGAEIYRKQTALDSFRKPARADELGAPSFAELNPEPEREKDDGLILGVLPTPSTAISTVKALASGERPGTVGFGREAAKQRSAAAPGLALDRGILDATSKALEQTTRVSSATAGGALAAAEGKNPLKGAVEGFKTNDKSFTQLAEKAGLKGAPAAIVGLVGDILLDPTTYASFGFKAPAHAAEIEIRRKLAKQYGKQARRAAKAGDEGAARAVAEAYERDLTTALKKTEKLESEHRGVQVGVRVLGKQVSTKGRVTAAAAKPVGKVTGRVQQTDRVNETLRAFSPAQRPQGATRAGHEKFREAEREAEALKSRVVRDAGRLAQKIQRAADGDPAKYRQIEAAVEAGTVDQLPPRLREAARAGDDFFSFVATKFEEATGRPLHLVDSILPGDRVDESLKLARSILEAGVRRSERGVARAKEELGAARVVVRSKNGSHAARKEERLAEEGQALNEAEQLAARLDGEARPVTVEEERALAGKLNDVLETFRRDARANIARTRTNEHLGAVRRGEVPDADSVRKALQAEDFHAKKARDLRAAGNRSGARQAEAVARTARRTVREYRDEYGARAIAELEQSGAKVLKGRAGRLEHQIDDLLRLVAHEPPVGYRPRQTTAALAAKLDPRNEGIKLLAGVSRGRAGHEFERQERRRRADMPDDGYYTDDAPVLTAIYGASMGPRLANLLLFRRVITTMSRPASVRAMEESAGETLFKVERDGTLVPVRDPQGKGAVLRAVEAETEAAAREGRAPTFDHVLVPNEVAAQLEVHTAKGEPPGKFLESYDTLLRGFKAANTIMRPGFFATSLVGNTWQMFLADASPRDMARAWRILSSLRAEGRQATRAGGSRVTELLDRAMSNQTFPVDGRMMSYGELFEEGISYGAVRTGSRIGDPLELSLERQATRRIGSGVAGQARKGVEFLNTLAEDVDDMTRAALYIRARTTLGQTPEQATKYAYTVMIDYGDLSRFERRFMKRLMPFYVYTSRNLPIQIRRLAARPGKLANFEKVRQSLAELSGLPSDWMNQLGEGDQERMPFPVPGIKSAGFQQYRYLRLPVEDLARPLQLLEGGRGAQRVVERYMGDLAPFIKVPIEEAIGKRLDYDRPISLPGYPPPAGSLLRSLGATIGEYQQPRTGEKYEGASPRLDHILRGLFGSPGALALNVGKQAPDRSNVSFANRTLSGWLGGQGVNAPDPRDAVEAKIRSDLSQLMDRRSDIRGRGKKDTAEDYRNEDAIDELNATLTRLRAAIGYPKDKEKLSALDIDELKRIFGGGLETPEMRELLHELDRPRRQSGL